MKVSTENYGSVVLLHVVGEVAPDDLEVFLAEVMAACMAACHVVIELARAELTLETTRPLLALRDQQRYLKPAIWLVSPRLEQASAGSLDELLSQKLAVPEARQIASISALKAEQARLTVSRNKIELELRQRLVLATGYTPEDFNEACRRLKTRTEKLRRQAAAIRRQVEKLRGACALALQAFERMGADERAESVEKVNDVKIRAYRAVKD